jgi:signal transduction histidine kinase
LFQRFYRGKTGRESGESGTGLGLAICKEIVDRHAGRIDVQSTPETGTSFTVWLPVGGPA